MKKKKSAKFSQVTPIQAHAVLVDVLGPKLFTLQDVESIMQIVYPTKSLSDFYENGVEFVGFVHDVSSTYQEFVYSGRGN